MNLISDEVIVDLQTEAQHAHHKHGDMSLLGDGLTRVERLAALVEEVGEAAKELTYDGSSVHSGLEHELIQVANVALSWVTWLRRPE